MIEGNPYIVCVGDPSGRAVVFGWAATEPEIGVPCRLERVRMILRFGTDDRGLFGIAALGPAPDTKMTVAVPATLCVPRQILIPTAEAADALSKH